VEKITLLVTYGIVPFRENLLSTVKILQW